MSKTFTGPPPVEPVIPKKPSPGESRRDRVAINVYQALISCGITHDPKAPCGRDGTWAEVYSRRAYDFADAFLAERDLRSGADEVI